MAKPNLDPLPPAVMERAEHPALAGFHEPLRAWFAASYAAPTAPQELGWPVIASGESCLLLAPTGSGKTLAAFLSAIDRLMFTPLPPKGERCRVLYVSPLKALAADVERNLQAPLIGVSRYAERLGADHQDPVIAVRTGDTPARERAAFQRNPADILITTPESLFLLLTSNARDVLTSVRTVIVDEIHTLVGGKRGTHLALSLERLEKLTGQPLQRIGLSATVQPHQEAARFLAGWHTPPLPAREERHEERSDPETLLDDPTSAVEASGRPREVVVVDAGSRRRLDLTVEVAVEDMARLGEVEELASGPAAGERRTSIWPAMHPLILQLIRSHRSTLIFVNSRRSAERLAAALNELAEENLVRAHHGSIAREQRLQIEDELKAGRVPALVATSTLELGIDMGAIDLVIQVEAPPSVTSGLQRIGRAGHDIESESKGVILPKFRCDLLACAALTLRMEEGLVEEVRYPRTPLDVLAQQIVGMAAVEEWDVDALFTTVRRAAPYAHLSRSLFEGVLDMLSGRYPSDDFAELRPRITWDRIGGTLRVREGARRLVVANAGSIPDRGLYGVFLAGEQDSRGRASRRVGELDEEMVHEAYVGDNIILGASTWKIEEITHDRVLVSPAPGEPGKMPFWHGDGPGRPLEFGRAIGRLCRELRSLSPEDAAGQLTERHSLTPRAAENLIAYLRDQEEAAGAVPDDQTLVIERYVDEMGDWRVCILGAWGSRVHAPWALALACLVRERYDFETDILWTDDGIVIRFPEADEPPPIELLLPDPDEVEELVIRQLGAGGGGARAAGMGAPVTALFASRFREAAGRALLLPRRYPGQRAPLWQQRKRSGDLLRAASGYGSFPIILETYRECLRDDFDMPALVQLLRQIQSREIRLLAVETRTPSPFAAALLFNYVANFMYEGDAPLAERRAQALTIDQTQLRELLGEVELRELLDAEALAELELTLQSLTETRRARHADGLHDLLLRLGDLDGSEIEARCNPPAGESAASWIEQLATERRAARVKIAGVARWIAAEEAGRYRDALGVPPPLGLPAAFLAFTEQPLEELISRYARTHGPFPIEEISARFGLGASPVRMILDRLEQRGRIMRGAFRPGGVGEEWCDSGVLRTLRQRSLSRLRRDVEPVEPAVLGRLYAEWQAVTRPRGGPDGLLEVIEILQGAPLAASDLERRILAPRVREYDPHLLDMLAASGQVVWVGVEPLGDRDGRVALYLLEHLSLLYRPPANPPAGAIHQSIRELLTARGASFYQQILQAAPAAPPADVLSALWDLVWCGEVTNDTLQPLRAFLSNWKQSGSGRRRRGAVSRRQIFPLESGGRWSLVAGLIHGEPAPTGRANATARQLLDRYGVVTREAVRAEGLQGGFSAVYPVFKAMEEAGRVRRGYFVAGCGAAQFALPGAVERLRALREPPPEPEIVALASSDPANPYGAAIAWPERAEGRRPGRSAGSVTLLVNGRLAAWLGRGERQLVTFVADAPGDEQAILRRGVAAALAGLVERGERRALFVREVDGLPVLQSPLGPELAQAGFVYGPHGYMKRT